MSEPVSLESIRRCFDGLIPSPFATCSPDGTPNVTYMSIVHYVDSERVALSRQFFNKTRANLDANPHGQVRVVDPTTLQEYALDLRFVRTESDGPIFDAMRANLDAIASQTGTEGLFRLRGADIHTVLRCVPVGPAPVAPVPATAPDPVARLEELTRKLGLSSDYDAATRSALEALEDLFGFDHAILLVRDPAGGRLFAVGDNGYRGTAAGAEVPLGVGLIGTAADRGEVVALANLARSRVMQAAVRSTIDQGEGAAEDREIPLPGLPQPQSVAAVPLVIRHEVTGVLYLESEEAGRYGPHNERLLRIIGHLLAATLGALSENEPEQAALTSPKAALSPTGEPLEVRYYQADDSVFVDGEYVIKGVPGRILWKLVNIYAHEGRDAFTNRELRLDEGLGLPAGADNLEARLLVLRRRLAGGSFGITLEHVARGRLSLRTSRPLALAEVPTSGPMRAAHEPESGA